MGKLMRCLSSALRKTHLSLLNTLRMVIEYDSIVSPTKSAGLRAILTSKWFYLWCRGQKNTLSNYIFWYRSALIITQLFHLLKVQVYEPYRHPNGFIYDAKVRKIHYPTTLFWYRSALIIPSRFDCCFINTFSLHAWFNQGHTITLKFL